MERNSSTSSSVSPSGTFVGTRPSVSRQLFASCAVAWTWGHTQAIHSASSNAWRQAPSRANTAGFRTSSGVFAGVPGASDTRGSPVALRRLTGVAVVVAWHRDNGSAYRRTERVSWRRAARDSRSQSLLVSGLLHEFIVRTKLLADCVDADVARDAVAREPAAAVPTSGCARAAGVATCRPTCLRGQPNRRPGPGWHRLTGPKRPTQVRGDRTTPRPPTAPRPDWHCPRR